MVPPADSLLPLRMIHAAATLTMVGVIWFVQVVHYPLLLQVGEAKFVSYEVAHTRRVGRLVGPLMLAELISAAWLAAVISEPTSRALAWSGSGLLAVIWLSTAAIQMPCHRRLSDGFDARIVRRLVTTNWIRTTAWSLRGVSALFLLVSP